MEKPVPNRLSFTGTQFHQGAIVPHRDHRLLPVDLNFDRVLAKVVNRTAASSDRGCYTNLHLERKNVHTVPIRSITFFGTNSGRFYGFQTETALLLKNEEKNIHCDLIPPVLFKSRFHGRVADQIVGSIHQNLLGQGRFGGHVFGVGHDEPWILGFFDNLFATICCIPLVDPRRKARSGTAQSHHGNHGRSASYTSHQHEETGGVALEPNPKPLISPHSLGFALPTTVTRRGDGTCCASKSTSNTLFLNDSGML